MTKFCNQCGAEVAEAQKFCNKCGTRLLPTTPTEPPPGYQAQGSAPPQSSPQATYQSPPPPASAAQMPYQAGYMSPAQQQYGNPAGGLGLTSNIIGALCYLVSPITAIIFLVIDPYNKDRFVRFHAWQSIFYAVAWVALKIALGILYFILPNFLVGMMSGIVGLGFFIGWIWLMIQAYQNKREKLPVIGDLAEQQAR
ncbi:MAG: zinc-ribbon domain-containing protein [Acidobacteria bacterium]|nr:zinc-ribbon domain-containing protein [Acidobacteriota bacterium]MBI3426716.1 zinc-ribbon domain-containing protein [Acidobacteriota bacterium]